MISIDKNGLKNVFQKKVKGKSNEIEFLKFRTFLFRFLSLTFFLNIFSPFWNQHKILSLKIPHTTFHETEFWLGSILALFANFECICSKNGTFTDILLKIKTFCFEYLSSVQSQFESRQVLKIRPILYNVHIPSTWLCRQHREIVLPPSGEIRKDRKWR